MVIPLILNSWWILKVLFRVYENCDLRRLNLMAQSGLISLQLLHFFLVLETAEACITAIKLLGLKMVIIMMMKVTIMLIVNRMRTMLLKIWHFFHLYLLNLLVDFDHTLKFLLRYFLIFAFIYTDWPNLFFIANDCFSFDSFMVYFGKKLVV